MKVIKRIVISALTIALLLLCADLLHEPAQQLSTKILIYSIEEYRIYVSPRLSNIVACKFKPSCSVYAIIALQKHGALKGTVLAIIRVLKCSPLSSAHGEDYP